MRIVRGEGEVEGVGEVDICMPYGRFFPGIDLPSFQPRSSASIYIIFGGVSWSTCWAMLSLALDASVALWSS